MTRLSWIVSLTLFVMASCGDDTRPPVKKDHTPGVGLEPSAVLPDGPTPPLPDKSITKVDVGISPQPDKPVTKPDGGLKPDVAAKKDGPFKVDIAAQQLDKPPLQKDAPPAVSGWGNKCNQTTPCPLGLTCVMLTGFTDGFCTKECPAANAGQECPGAPAGTMAGCLLSDQARTKYFCAFVCALQGQTFNCPTQLSCDTAENPPGSGQKACVPKSTTPDASLPKPDLASPKTDTGPVVTTGWGDLCNQTKPCPTGLTCIMLTGFTDGFCTKECPKANAGQQCVGTPAGQLAGCLLSDQAQTKYFCAFVCALPGQTYSCPSQLSCDAAENPPGSGQKACVPKPPATTGWGNKCNQTMPCPTGLTCIMLAGFSDGFCTKECPASSAGMECPNAPPGTLAGCLLSDQARTKFYCSFLCALPGQTFQCPTQLSCDTVENPPGSGQKACVPK